MLSAPLWLPCAAVYGLMRICGDGLLFVLEGSGRSLALRNPLQRLLFYIVALPVFPLVITVDTALSFLLQLQPVRRIGSCSSCLLLLLPRRRVRFLLLLELPFLLQNV